MRATLFAMVVPFLFCGCAGCRGCIRPPAGTPEIDPALAAEINLHEIPGAQPLDKSVENKTFLLVNEQGVVLLTPEDQYKDAEGNIIATLVNPAQVFSFLKRRAKQDRDQAKRAREAGRTKEGDPELSTIVLLVHKDCPFEKSYPIVNVARLAGFTNYRWRVNRGADGEGELIQVVHDVRHVIEPEVFARATSDAAGRLAKITLHGDGIPKDGLDFRTDTDAFHAGLVAASKIRPVPPEFFPEIDARLLHSDVLRVLDACIRAGYQNVWPVPIEEAKK